MEYWSIGVLEDCSCELYRSNVGELLHWSSSGGVWAIEGVRGEDDDGCLHEKDK
jgi:hypothetical protein